MHLQRRRAHTPLRRAALVTASLASLGLLATAGPVVASQGEASESTSDPRCDTAAEKKKLARAGDNFALACLPGEDFRQGRPSAAALEAGQRASSKNMKLLANVPKQGAFAESGAYNSDLAFKGRYAFAGNYYGFTVYDISKPRKPKAVTQYVCPGGQGDVSVSGDILVFSVDSSRSSSSCSDSTPTPASEKTAWEGLRIFDISNPRNPQYVKAIETDCGSHTNSLAPSKDGKDVYVYVSSYSPSADFPDCQPAHDKISVVKIPASAPRDAAVVNEPVLFPDGGYAGGVRGDGVRNSATTGCHDITTYPRKDVAAGACMGDGVLIDISDRENPVVTERVQDTENFAFWHSATFNDRGTKVVFTDELGGGGAATCNPRVGSTKGANGIYDIVAGKLQFKSYYKMPRTQSDTENCVAHNGSLIPVKGKDVMVQAWYQGGISVYDFTTSSKPKEIGWFDRGPLSSRELQLGGSWSAYYYNGFIYSNDIQKGLDVLELRDKRTDSARKVRMSVLNPQAQTTYRR
ncbi:LVIVD repeat-containing protein [Nocardioides scoriae]|uniref:LVIVD repeat-containing protein n=1 Tax=Nocardioides scoriae TaxID=642780 RepID=A0A1H1WQG4_9ACTN|nr:hypothetical protein [Nocardioides scoriae]SDS99487.1 LVIVD repeat-containing protein [Nocardioides scoriae]